MRFFIEEDEEDSLFRARRFLERYFLIFFIVFLRFAFGFFSFDDVNNPILSLVISFFGSLKTNVEEMQVSQLVFVDQKKMNRPKKPWTKQDDAAERVLLASFNVRVYYELMTPEEGERARTAYYSFREQTKLLDRRKTPDEGVEPSTTRLKVWRSTY